MRRTRWLCLLLALALVWLLSTAWQAGKPLPTGINQSGPWRAAENTRFLADLTYLDRHGQRQSRQAIFDEVFALIGQARKLIVLDMFLFNDFGSVQTEVFRPLSQELTQALLDRMAQAPDLRVIIITDPVNTVYGALPSPQLERLQDAGAQIIITDLRPLRASNPAWTGLWALCCSWLDNSAAGGWLPNPFGGQAISLRSWLALPNFRANHRKTLVTDDGDSWQAMILSANPHDGSSAHDNVALRFSGAAALDLLQAEAAVAAFSGAVLQNLPAPALQASVQTRPRLRILSEGAIHAAVLQTIESATTDETLDIAMFYLSERRIIRALKAAQERGVPIRLLLDPNEDAFGRKKNGVPNRPVAAELVRAGIDLRWCDTHGEQCHSKFLLRQGPHESTLILGSGNFTRRNLRNLNLEMDVQLVAEPSNANIENARHGFDAQWTNAGQKTYSAPWARYADHSLWHRIWYRFGEGSGFSSW